MSGFTEEQKQYLAGFTLGQDVARSSQQLPVLGGSYGDQSMRETVTIGSSESAPAGVDALAWNAQNRQTEAGGKLCKEEKAKRESNPLDLWDKMREHARSGEFPKGTDVFLWKFQGLFHVAPAQNSFMCRLRIPGGILSSYQFRGMAEIADKYAGGYVDCTTRGNLQFREIGPENGVHLLDGLFRYGVVAKGSGGDNIRNVTASALSGIDTRELTETYDLAVEWQNYILHHRELIGLPRKFNVAFDGGGSISSLEDTNDIGFIAVRISEENATQEVPAGVHFRLTLGGITGHEDFARDTGVLCTRDECSDIAGAICRVFIDTGGRTDRKKARMKYVLDDIGFEGYLEKVEEKLGYKLKRFDLSKCEQREPADRYAHVGFHRQKQDGISYVGVVLPVGRIQSDQVRGLADIAEKYGSGEVRLTVWQNVLVPGIKESDIDAVKAAIEDLGLHHEAANVRAGLVACTGSAGCKFAGADTKAHAMAIAHYMEGRVELDKPLNIHVTGCHHSCAQHYIGDLGLIACAAENSEGDMVEGYHVFVGGGYGPDDEGQGAMIGRQLFEAIPAEDCPPLIEHVLLTYLDGREGDEPFAAWARRQDMAALNDECLDSMAV